MQLEDSQLSGAFFKSRDSSNIISYPMTRNCYGADVAQNYTVFMMFFILISILFPGSTCNTLPVQQYLKVSNMFSLPFGNWGDGVGGEVSVQTHPTSEETFFVYYASQLMAKSQYRFTPQKQFRFSIIADPFKTLKMDNLIMSVQILTCSSFVVTLRVFEF